MRIDYSKRQDVTIDEFKKCVEFCFPKLHLLRDDLQRGNSINREACQKITNGNPSQYIPHNLELFVWKQINDINEIICSATCYCGKLGLFDKYHLTYGACCQEHSKDNRIKKSEQATIKKYGVAYNLQNKTTHQKTLEKWGGKSPFSNKEIQEKSHNTIKEKYGVDNAMQNKTFCNKSRKTRLEIYGTEKANPEKARATMKERYGVDYFSQSDRFKKLWPVNGGDPEFNKNIREKEYFTKKANNSFNTSKEEDKVFLLLKEKFGDEVINQYIDERYPYKCDFYIPSLDLFIEYQGTWTHGGHPFNSTDSKDIETVNHWITLSKTINFKNEEKDYYQKAVENWTILDVTKRTIAKKNKLNFKEFFTLQQVITWLESV